MSTWSPEEEAERRTPRARAAKELERIYPSVLYPWHATTPTGNGLVSLFFLVIFVPVMWWLWKVASGLGLLQSPFLRVGIFGYGPVGNLIVTFIFPATLYGSLSLAGLFARWVHFPLLWHKHRQLDQREG